VGACGAHARLRFCTQIKSDAQMMSVAIQATTIRFERGSIGRL
jgi:hypothetical protein